MMRRHRSTKRPFSRTAAARKSPATAVTENLEGRCLLSGLGGLPGSVLPFVYVGPLMAQGEASPVAKGKARAAAGQRPPPSAAPGRATASAPSVTAASVADGRPFITGVYPSNNSGDIPPDAFIAADLFFPVAGAVVDPSTLNSNTVRLVRTRDNTPVAGVPKTDGAAGVIILKPADLLDPNTTYRFQVTSGLRDTAGNAFESFSSTFTTGGTVAATDPTIAFEKVSLPVTQGNRYTAVTFGPDGKLYAATNLGSIHRFTVGADGVLAAPQVVNTVVLNNNGIKRLVTGLEFDPKATANNLLLWVTHSQYSNGVGEDWTGKVSRLSGANLEVYHDYVVGLPRSVRDHLTNQMDFGPDGALYIGQGSNNALGAPDPIWGMRPERLLAGAILRLDTSKINPAQGPLNAKTDEGGTYNPWAAGAPLTLYATGLRNVYDLVWTRNGQLYAPANGSAAGGNAPGYDGTSAVPTRIDQATSGPYSGGPVASLTNVRTTENDYLFRIEPGGYYGHPNPTRGEYVLHGGNPTAGADADEWTQYPVGTLPDRNYRHDANDRYVFGRNFSPNGVIQYAGGAFGSALDGRLMVARYSGGDDIVIIDVAADGAVTRVQRGLAGLSNLDSPLDLAEDPASGFLYVSEYGGQRLTLLRPVAAGANISLVAGNNGRLFFNEPVGGNAGEGATRTVTITNTGTAPLAVPADGLRISGPDLGFFRITAKPVLPTTIAPGQSVEVKVAFGAPSGASQGVKTATLEIKTNDPDQQVIPIQLRGLATAGVGGSLEPSLQRILDLYQIPVNTGDADPATADLLSTAEPLRTPNDEIAARRLVKFNPAAPVTVEPLAVFGSDDTKAAVRFGWYDAGSKQARVELFSVDQLESQSVSPTPIGTTTFDPGAEGFSVFSIWPPFSNREIYGEDVLNTGEPNAALRRLVHFYPLKNPDGSVVPDAVVAAFEEFYRSNAPNNSTDSNDLVVVLRNVKAAPDGAEIGLENADSAPYYDRLVFSRIQNPTTSLGTAATHELATLRIWNTGTQTLTVTGLTPSSGAFRVEPAVALPLNIPVGESRPVQVRFVGTAAGGDIQNATLRITSNDPDETNVDVQLSGSWQSVPENGQEPDLAQILQVFDYRTTLVNPGQLLSNGGKLEAVGEEVLSPYWVRSDNTKPVSVFQIAAYHTQAVEHPVRWHSKGSETVNEILRNFANDAQSLLPRKAGGTLPAIGTFEGSTSTPFGFKIGNEWSDPAKNLTPTLPNDQGHHVRFFPLRLRNPNSPDQTRVVRDTWLMVMDFSGINYDYNDNVYVVNNMRPAPPPAPVGVIATSQEPQGFLLAWSPNADPLTTSYSVYRSLGPDGGFEKVNRTPVTAAQFLDTTASRGATYYYKITALDNWGGETSRTVVGAVRADYTAPPVPATLAATPVTTGGVTLSWAGVTADDLAGYRVYRGGSATGPFTALNNGGVIPASTTTINDATAFGGFTWYYQLVAVDANNNESEPATASALGVGGPPAAMLTSALPVTEAGGTLYTFTVTFTESSVLNAESLANSVVVAGPGGFSQAAQVLSVEGRNVTYSITPPGGTWEAADDGVYTITFQPNKVGDGKGNFVAAGPLGTFQADPPAGPGGSPETAIDLGTFAGRGKKVLKDALAAGKSEMFFKITTTQPARLKAAVGKVKGDVAFQLLDASGTTVLAASDRPRRRPEAVRKPLPPGTYVLHVTLKEQVNTNFVIKTGLGRPSRKELQAMGLAPAPRG